MDKVLKKDVLYHCETAANSMKGANRMSNNDALTRSEVEKIAKALPTAATRGSVVWFITEQARILASETGRDSNDFNTCRKAIEFLANSDGETLAYFREQTENTPPPNPEHLRDPETEEYPAKRQDMLAAVAELTRLGNDGATAENIRETLLDMADIIGCFYGAGLLDEEVA